MVSVHNQLHNDSYLYGKYETTVKNILKVSEVLVFYSHLLIIISIRCFLSKAGEPAIGNNRIKLKGVS